MTCDFMDDDRWHCGEDEAYEQTVYCKTGQDSLIIYKCSEHKNENITFSRMIEIIEEHPALYGVNAARKLDCYCLVNLDNGDTDEETSTKMEKLP